MCRYGTGLIAPPASALTLQSFLLIDQWVGAIKADTSSASLAEKVVHAKPATAVDFCYLTSDTTFATKVTDFATCGTDPRLKRHASPRQVAGGPLSEDVLKCQLKPINRSDYAAVGLSDDQFNRLSAAFPQGVCDFSKPGVGQVPAVWPARLLERARRHRLPRFAHVSPDLALISGRHLEAAGLLLEAHLVPVIRRPQGCN